MSGTVVRVKDGDTAVVRLDSGEISVRFHGIDAPEGKAPFGREATAALRARLPVGKDVGLLPVEQDRYERLVAVVYAGGMSVNEAMVASGHAWAYRKYLGQVPGDEHYCELEAAARAAHSGLWSQPVQRWVPPWIYRKRQDAPPGAQVPSRDYSGETAADCVAAMRQARQSRQSGAAGAAVSGNAGGQATQGKCLIKGNINRKGDKIYHLPGGPSYEDTRINTPAGERWFCTEQEAQAAGWRAPRQNR